MAISKFSVRMLVLVVMCWSLSTCSFKNNYSWTYPEEVKRPIVHLPHFCSQASSLLSPVANLTTTLPANTSSAATNKITAVESLPPTVCTASSVYIGSRSTDLHSPVPPIYTIKSFPLILSLLSLLLLIVVMLLLAIWMCYLVPVMSYLIVSSICETLSLSPTTLLNAIKKKLEEIGESCLSILLPTSSLIRLGISHVWLIRLHTRQRCVV